MAAIALNLRPTDKQLRQFGLIAIVAMPLAGWLFSGKPSLAAWTPFHTNLIAGLAGLGAMMGAAGWWCPRLLKWIFVGLSVVVFPIGFVLGELILLVIYSVAFVPIAILFRCVGRDALRRKLEPDVDSYWQPKERPKNAASYYRQF